ncbi:MAG: hypothetical protein HC895_04000 [Leptolyngbyaceae cyanobacterium SM1_3_5]|nr:hypothetical protein [Leptolyngbyaceae cyanobacterium SM1_3_5]
MKAIDPKLLSEILVPLLELEVSNANKIGKQIHPQVFKILCSFNETEFEAETLQLIKAKADAIEEYRLRKYQVELGEKQQLLQNYCINLRIKIRLCNRGQHSH